MPTLPGGVQVHNQSRGVDHVWTIEKIVNLLDQKEQLVIQAGALERGSYKKRANVKNSH